MALSAEEQALLRQRAGIVDDPMDAGLAGGVAAPPPPPPPPAAVVTPVPSAPVEPPTIHALPGAAPVLPPDAAARAQNASLMLPPTGAPPQKNTVGYTGPSPEEAAALNGPPPEPLQTTSSGSSVSKGIKLSPETKAARAEATATQHQANALEDKGFLAAREAQERGLEKQAAGERAVANAAREEGEHNTAILASKRAHIEKLVADVGEMKVDPNHYWAERSTGQKIAAILALTAGGFAAGWRGGPNTAAEMLQKAIDNDIAAQRANIDNKRGAIQGQATLYNMTSAGFKDSEERHQAARIAGMAAARKEIDATIMRASDPLEKARLLQVRAGVDRQMMLDSAKLDEMTQDKVSFHSSSSVQKGGPTSGGLPSDRVVRGPDGKLYMVDSPASAQKLRESGAVHARLEKNVAEAQNLLSHGGQMPLTETRDALKQKVAEIRRDYIALNGEKLKAGGKGVDEILDDVIGTPESLFDWHGSARLNALGQSLKTDMADQYTAYNAQPLTGASYAIQGGKPVVQAPALPVLPAGKGGRR